MSEEFEVDAKSLRADSNFSRSAAASATTAANALAQIQLPYGVFGNFDEALLFGLLLATVRDEQVRQLHADHVALADIADEAHATAQARADADEELARRSRPREP